MADDISKKITIEVEAQTDKLQQNIADLNQIINELQANQQKLIATGNENSAAFEKNATAIDKYQKQLTTANKQIAAFTSAINSSGTSLQKSQSLVDALTKANDKLSGSVSGSASKLKELDTNTKALTSSTQNHQAKATQSKTLQDAHNKSIADGAKQANQLKKGISGVNTGLQKQQSQTKSSKTAFEAHTTTMQTLSTEFDKLKGISGTFGPSLAEAAQGFNIMKTGLSVVQTGFKGVGTAIRETGFGFLIQLLQNAFDYFVNTSEGSKKLKGAISAIGVVVNMVKGFFEKFKSGIFDAVTHPVESLKALGKMIVENVINRFKAFSVILDGIVHLDFKKIGDGVLQAATGVTNATDKMKKAFNTVVATVKDTAKAMTNAYDDGTKMDDKQSKNIDQRVKKHKESFSEIEQAHKDSLARQLQETNQAFADQALAASQRYADEKANLEQSLNDKLISKAEYYEKLQKLESDYHASIGNIMKGFNKGSANTRDQQRGQAPLTVGGTYALGNSPPTTASIVSNKTNQEQSNITEVTTKVENQRTKFAIESAKKVADTTFSIISRSIQAQSAAKIKSLENDKAQELSNSSLTSAQKMAIEAKYKKQEAAVKNKAFKDEQKASIAQAIINGAIAITKAEAQTGVLGAFAIPAIIAGTAIQVATIASQKPPAYARGGLHYQSDGRGGVLPGYSRYDNTNAYLRSGEGIVVSEAMQVPWARNLVSAINVGFGGRDFSAPVTSPGFAVGGIFTDGGNANRYYNQPVNDQKNLANTVAYQMINNFPPVYVDVKDVNNQQNILAQTVNRVNL